MNFTEWIRRVEDTVLRHLYKVVKPYASINSGLKEGDLILTMGNELVTRPSSLFKPDFPPSLDIVILRNREVITTSITTFPAEELETTRVIFFCGAIIQAPNLSVRQYALKLYSEVYVASYISGSPWPRYTGKWNSFITHINGVPTPDLDAFFNEVSKVEDNTYLQVTAMTNDNIPWVKNLRRDEHFFPITEYRRDRREASGWRTTVGSETVNGKAN
jgi:hypothetical protein